MMALCGLGTRNAFAQYDKDIFPPRLKVNPPTNINNTIQFTYSYASNPTWGADLPVVTNQEVVKAAPDSLACGTINTVSGKWVLIYRGNCEFGAKAKKAQDNGATGVIIWNHTPNSALVQMGGGAQGSGVTIPVIFISNEDGRKMTEQLSSGSQLFISLTKWGFGNVHDVAIVPSSGVLPPYGAIPQVQLGDDVAAYRHYTGAFVANTGQSNETNVKIKANVNFTPTGGSSSPVYSDSATIPSISSPTAAADSIGTAFSPNTYKFAPSGTGRYDINYNVTMDNSDQLTIDNSESASMEVTTNAWCKGRFNASTQEPVIGSFIATTNGSGAVYTTIGPLLFVHKGNYTLESIKFAMMNRDTTVKHMNAGNYDRVTFFIFKWKDGTGGPSDGYMQAGELSLVSTATKVFTAEDSNSAWNMYKTSCKNSEGKDGIVSTENDTYYWIAADLGVDFALGSDIKNPWTRSYAAKHATSSTLDFWSPRYDKSGLDVATNPADVISLIPFGFSIASSTTGNSNNIDSTRYDYTDGTIANVALFTSVFPTDVKKTTNVVAKDKMTLYPNPVTDNFTVSVDLFERAEKVNFKIVDAFGRRVYDEYRKDVWKGDYKFSVNGIAQGNYYMVLTTNDNTLVKPFTVVGK